MRKKLFSECKRGTEHRGCSGRNLGKCNQEQMQAYNFSLSLTFQSTFLPWEELTMPCTKVAGLSYRHHSHSRKKGKKNCLRTLPPIFLSLSTANTQVGMAYQERQCWDWNRSFPPLSEHKRKYQVLSTQWLSTEGDELTVLKRVSFKYLMKLMENSLERSKQCHDMY